MDKKFIACGVGNAIVDVIVKVSFHDLVLLGLNKDESCLIDLDKKNKIKQFIKDKSPKVSCGGSIANSIFTLSSLYGNSAFIGALGDDNFGRTFIQELKMLSDALSKTISKIDEIPDYLSTGVVGCAIGRDFYHNMSSYDEITKRAKKAISLIKQMDS